MRRIAEWFEVLRNCHVQRHIYGWWVYCPCTERLFDSRVAAFAWVLRHSWQVAGDNDKTRRFMEGTRG